MKVLEGPLLLILTFIAFAEGLDILNVFRKEWWGWCPELRRNACDPEGVFRGRMDALKGNVKHREEYVHKLKDLQKKIKEYDELTMSRRQDSRGRRYSPTQDVENDIKALHSKVNDMGKEMKEILSFLTDHDFDKNPKNSKKFQGVVKWEETGKLEDRMAKMEERLSKITFSDTLKNIEYMHKLVGNTIKEFTPKFNKLDTMERELREVDVMKIQLSKLNQSYTRTAQNLQALEGNALDAYRQSLKLQRNLRNRSSSVSEKFEKYLEDFIEDWTKNCSRSENPCLPFTQEHLRFLRSSDEASANTLVEKKVTPHVLGSLYWGCSPIIPESSSNVIIRRHWKEKMITFSCPKNNILIGPKYVLCRNKKWRPYAKPICKSRYTYLNIPSCPEIKLAANSSLIFEVNKQEQFVDFDCPEGEALRGPSRFWCRKGSWHPKTDPITECYTL